MFAYKLMTKLGGDGDVDKFMAGLSAEQFEEWKLIYMDDPWDEIRADLRCGIIAAAIINSNRKRGARAISPSEASATMGGTLKTMAKMAAPKNNGEMMALAMKKMTLMMGGDVREGRKVTRSKHGHHS
jgi:hypothetical protein